MRTIGFKKKYAKDKEAVESKPRNVTEYESKALKYKTSN